jgi:hypothetical protein
MSRSRPVLTTLLRIYRPVGLWFWCTMIICIAAVDTLLATHDSVNFSLWLLVAGTAAKYWLLVVGLLLINAQLKQFVTNGVTRRDFRTGSAVFGLVAAVLFALIVVAGHGVEQALTGLAGPLPADYPDLSASSALSEFGHVLPAELAYLVSGAAIAAGFYRYGPLPGLLIIVPGLVPVALTETLLGRGPHGEPLTRFLPYGVALVVTLVAVALVALMYSRELRDVTIRRSAG